MEAFRWISASSLFFTGMAICVKQLVALGMPEGEVVFFRLFLNFLVVAAWMACRGHSFRFEGSRGLLFFRGVCGFVAVSALFLSVSRLPLPVASLLYWSSPLFVVLFSQVIFKEASPRALLPFLGLAFVGLTLLLNVRKEQLLGSYPLSSVLIGLGGSMAGALAYLTVRRATARVSPHGIVLAFTGVGSVLSLPWLFSVYETPRPEQWAWLLGLGGSAVLGQYLMTRGYGVAPASVVSSLNLLNAAFSALSGWVFFGESLAWAQWRGMGLMVAGIVAVALQAASRPARRTWEARVVS